MRYADRALSFDRITASAREEILHPTLGITEQILDVHSVAMQDGEPQVTAVDQPVSSDHAFVFFDVVGEPYHLWVRVAVEGARVQFAGITPLTYIELVVSSLEHTPEDIAAVLGTPATSAYHRGERSPQGARTYGTNVWIYEPLPRMAGFFEDRLRQFARAVRSLQEGVRRLPAGCEVEVSIVSKQCSAWPEGFHVPADVGADLFALRASLDIDVYYFGPEALGR